MRLSALVGGYAFAHADGRFNRVPSPQSRPSLRTGVIKLEFAGAQLRLHGAVDEDSTSRLNDETSSLVFGILVYQLRFHTASADSGIAAAGQDGMLDRLLWPEPRTRCIAVKAGCLRLQNALATVL